MNYQGWFKTTAGEILLRFAAGKNNNERQENFIRAAAEAESTAGVFILVNDEGRQRINEAKGH